MRAVAGLLLVLHAWSVPAEVCAQEHTTPTEALEYFQRARVHYREGRYPDAAVELERALTLDPSSPTLSYNLARVYELMGRLEDALARYRAYLNVLPAAEHEERARTAETIQRLEGAIAAGPDNQGPQESAPAEPLRELEGHVLVRERGVADAAFFAMMGTGAAILVASAITGGLALERAAARDGVVLMDPATRDQDLARIESLDADASVLGITTDVLLAAGGATLLAGLLLFVLREQEVEREIVPDRASLLPFVGASEHAVIAGVRGRL